ncbi:3D domain-containing protein [Eubacterium uniforme]|uniref:3D domain-containing protein n=1 Tax=Eubacterium uniforme TaxID=39495 RepID=A0A1T4V4T1_9FIRM|nr:3D domain-containing protein [Eubacterium uniforme]SKA59945.1 3D domain-containing protein [Eubacterium uniforme]
MKTLKNFAVGIAVVALIPASIFAKADTESLKTNKIVKEEKLVTGENEVEVKELNLPILTSRKPGDMNSISYSSKILTNAFAEGIKESNNKKSELKKDNKTDKFKAKKKSKKKSKKKKQKKLIGNFKITAYCIHGRTASGTTTTANRTIAADPSVLPYGTEVVINGKTYVVEDTGGAIKNNRIDIYMSTYDEAIQWGVKNVDVYYAK